MEFSYKTKKTGIITDIAVRLLIGCVLTGILYLITYYVAVINSFFMAVISFMIIILTILAFYAMTENDRGFLKIFFVILLISVDLSIIRLDIANINGAEEVLSSKILDYKKRKYCIFHFNDKQLRAAINRHNQMIINKEKASESLILNL